MPEMLDGCVVIHRYEDGCSLRCTCGTNFYVAYADMTGYEKLWRCADCAAAPGIESVVVMGKLVPQDIPAKMPSLPSYKAPAHIGHNGNHKGEPCYDTVLRAYAACRKEFETKDGVNVSHLIVATWEIDSIRYGLNFYSNQYPDSKRVYVEIVKMCKGIKPNTAFLIKTVPLRYKLTEAGEWRIKMLLAKTKGAKS